MTKEKLSIQYLIKGVALFVSGILLVCVITACWRCFGVEPPYDLSPEKCNFGRDFIISISNVIKFGSVIIGIGLALWGVVLTVMGLNPNEKEFKDKVKQLTKEGK